MRELFELFIHFIVTLIKLSKPGGVKKVMLEALAMKQQLLVERRSYKRSPTLFTRDRILFGLFAFFIPRQRLQKIAVIIKPATVLNFHRALVNKKLSNLYSNKSKKKPGRKPPQQELIDLIIELKKRNPFVGYGRISMQIIEAFGIDISRFAVGRLLRKHHHKCKRSF